MADYGRGVITRERGKYRVRIPDGKGGYIAGGTYATMPEAERMRDALLLERGNVAGATGLALQQYGERVIERWIRAGMRDGKTMRSRWSGLVCRADFARGPIECITRAEVRDWARSLPMQTGSRAIRRGGTVERIDTGKPLSWQSCKHALGLLGRVLDEAVEDGLRADNPARGVELQRRQDRAEGWAWLNADELRDVLQLDLGPQPRLAIALAVYQGLRQGELAALRWEDVDLDAGWLLVRSSWDGATKSGRVRRIPLLRPAARALQEWAPNPSKRVGLVLQAPGGGMWSRGYDWGWGDRRAGPCIPERAGIKRRVRWHDLRHTCAAHLVSGTWGRAWRLAEVREYLGHTDEAVTQRYAHLCPDALQATARATTAETQPAAHLPQSVAHAARVLLDFQREIQGQAVRDSNAWPSAPEAQGIAIVSRPDGTLRQVRGGFAEAVLQAAAEGRGVPLDALAQVACGALDADALRALAGGPDGVRAAVELAAREAAAPGKGRAAK